MVTANLVLGRKSAPETSGQSLPSLLHAGRATRPLLWRQMEKPSPNQPVEQRAIHSLLLPLYCAARADGAVGGCPVINDKGTGITGPVPKPLLPLAFSEWGPLINFGATKVQRSFVVLTLPLIGGSDPVGVVMVMLQLVRSCGSGQHASNVQAAVVQFLMIVGTNSGHADWACPATAPKSNDEKISRFM